MHSNASKYLVNLLTHFANERAKHLNDRFFIERRRGTALQIPYYQYRRFCRITR